MDEKDKFFCRGINNLINVDGINPGDLAEKAKIGPPKAESDSGRITIQRIINEDRGPTFDQAFKLAEFFGMSIEQIIDVGKKLSDKKNDMELNRLLGMAQKILKSSTIYSKTLSVNIKTLFDALIKEEAKAEKTNYINKKT